MKKLLGFFKIEFPNDVMDIRDGIELLCQCLDNTIQNINEKAATAFSERKFDQMESLTECVKQIDEMQIKLESYASLLDLDEDIEEYISNPETSDSEDKRIPNYSEYIVDSDVAYSLIDDFTHKRPAAFSLLGERIEALEWKHIFLLTCEELVKINKDIFDGFVCDKTFQGRKIAYFVKDPIGIRRPEKIAGTDIYVTTNMSANSIRNVILKMLGKYSIKPNDYKIFMRADYTALHE